MAKRGQEVEEIGAKGTAKPPKYPFYRNKGTGGIYPAMSSPSGYEDKNPDDWEPATDEEIKVEQAKLLEIREAKKAELRAQSAANEKLVDTAAVPTPSPLADQKVVAAPGALPAAGGPVLPGK